MKDFLKDFASFIGKFAFPIFFLLFIFGMIVFYWLIPESKEVVETASTVAKDGKEGGEGSDWSTIFIVIGSAIAVIAALIIGIVFRKKSLPWLIGAAGVGSGWYLFHRFFMEYPVEESEKSGGVIGFLSREWILFLAAGVFVGAVIYFFRKWKPTPGTAGAGGTPQGTPPEKVKDEKEEKEYDPWEMILRAIVGVVVSIAVFIFVDFPQKEILLAWPLLAYSLMVFGIFILASIWSEKVGAVAFMGWIILVPLFMSTEKGRIFAPIQKWSEIFWEGMGFQPDEIRFPVQIGTVILSLVFLTAWWIASLPKPEKGTGVVSVAWLLTLAIEFIILSHFAWK